MTAPFLGSLGAENVVGEDMVEGLVLANCRAVESRQITGFTRASRIITVSAETTGRLLELVGVEGRAIIGATSDGVLTRVARVDSASLQIELAAVKIALQQAESELLYYEQEEVRVHRLGELASDEARQTREHRTELATLSVAAAKTEVAMAEDRLRRSDVYAERGLIVLHRLAEPGSFVTAGTPLLELGDYRTLEVEVTLSEEEIAAVRAQTPVHLYLTNYPGFDAEAPIEVEALRVFPEFDEVSRKRRVEFEVQSDLLPEASGGLRMVLNVEIPDASGAYAIPAGFVQSRYDEYFVQTSQGPQRVSVVRRNAEEFIVMGEGLRDDTVIHAIR